MNLHIRTSEQAQQLSPVDYIRWRSGVVTEIALHLAQRFTDEEIDLVIDGPYSMQVIRDGYCSSPPRIYKYGEESSFQDRVLENMAYHLRGTFLQVELVHMDGVYEEIFQAARTYCRTFPNKIE